MIPDRVLFHNVPCRCEEGPAGDGSTFDVTADGRLRHAITEEVRLPEEEWPTVPGDPWHGLVGTNKSVVIGWSPTLYTGTLRLHRESDGAPVILEFERGKLQGSRVSERPVSDGDAVLGAAVAPGSLEDDGGAW